MTINLKPTYISAKEAFSKEECATFVSMVIFPAFEYHEVTPVTKGERLSLVAFVNGPNFR